MATGSSEVQDIPPVTEPASGDRIAVLVRLLPEKHRKMRLAMAEAGIRTNQEFAEAAIDEKVARVSNRRGNEDRRRGDRRAA